MLYFPRNESRGAHQAPRRETGGAGLDLSFFGFLTSFLLLLFPLAIIISWLMRSRRFASLTAHCKRYSQRRRAVSKISDFAADQAEAVASAIHGEVDRVSQTLTSRIRVLADRYASPLPQIVDEVAALAAKVDGHLKKMGEGSRGGAENAE